MCLFLITRRHPQSNRPDTLFPDTTLFLSDPRTRSDQRRRTSVTLNPSRWSFRNQCLAGFPACVALVGFSIFSQFQWNLQPCPLCLFQRIAFAALALVLLVAGLHAPKGEIGRATCRDSVC